MEEINMSDIYYVTINFTVQVQLKMSFHDFPCHSHQLQVEIIDGIGKYNNFSFILFTLSYGRCVYIN